MTRLTTEIIYCRGIYEKDTLVLCFTVFLPCGVRTSGSPHAQHTEQDARNERPHSYAK